MRTAALLSVLLIVQVAAGQPATAPATAPATGPSPTGREFASFGVSFTPPAAPWKRVVEGGTGHVARWARYGAGGRPDAMLVLEMEPLGGRSLEQFLAATTKRSGGSAAPAADLSMGGARTTRVTGGNLAGSAVEALVAEQAGYAYVASTFADRPNLLPRDAAEALARSIKFTPHAVPWTYTALRGESFPILDRIRLTPLATMRPNPKQRSGDSIGVSVFDFRTNSPAFILEMQVVPNPQETPLDVLQKAFPGKLNPAHKASWTRTHDAPARSMSDTFDVMLPSGGSMKARIGLVLLPATKEAVLLNFHYLASEPQALAAYERGSEAVMKSVEVIKK